MELLVLGEAANPESSDAAPPKDYQLVMPDESNNTIGPMIDQAGSASDPWRHLMDSIANLWPPERWRDVGVVVGCSGGADSVALLAALDQLRQQGAGKPKGFLVAAHFNHRLRGRDSDDDQAFVEELARSKQLQVAVTRGDAEVRDEATLRGQRIEFLTGTAHQLGARYVALAHSADDNVETVLHHLMRGTGPSGLAGIQRHRPLGTDLVLIRPLLETRRELIRQALEAIGQAWREDASNADLDYRRNWIRHQVVPMLKQQFPQAEEAILRAIDGQRQWSDLIHSLADDWIESHQRGSNPLVLVCDPAAPQAVLVAALQKLWDRHDWPRREMNQSHWRRLAEAIQSTRGDRFSLPGQIDVNIENSAATISR